MIQDIPKCVTVFIDGQAGSCGKGKVIGEYALNNKVDVAVANCMPNAGHTFKNGNETRIFRHIPISAVNKNTVLLLGPETEIDMDVLEKEYHDNKDILEGRDIIAHPMIPLIKPKHIKDEMNRIKSGTTFKGCGACRSDKIMRDSNLEFFKGYKNIRVSYDYYDILFNALENGKEVVLEIPQGCDLDINHSRHYPYVTSREVNVANSLGESGISPFFLKNVVMIIRPYPIRISNTIYNGEQVYSGPFGNSQELSWKQINVGSYYGIPATTVDDELLEELPEDILDFTEYTTVTQKERRVFELDINRQRFNIRHNRAQEIYLNFFEHLDSGFLNVSGSFSEIDINKYLREYLNYLEIEFGVPITSLGTGSDVTSVIKRARTIHN